MLMHLSNFQAAIAQAIRAQEQYEQKIGYTSDSAYLEGLRQVLEASKRGERIEVK